mmetsp:Transcript_34030/g.88488  ORF Transcript_34030/g.88488 Transcript_34030/m.88488 type:complete len:165 (-) Transcript_34030:1276-1770(-)
MKSAMASDRRIVPQAVSPLRHMPPAPVAVDAAAAERGMLYEGAAAGCGGKGVSARLQLLPEAAAALQDERRAETIARKMSKVTVRGGETAIASATETGTKKKQTYRQLWVGGNQRIRMSLVSAVPAGRRRNAASLRTTTKNGKDLLQPALQAEAMALVVPTMTR